MTHRFILDGQPLVYNAERKLGKTTIEEPFFKAGKILGWDPSCGSPGIGLNEKICEFIIKREATLIVHVASAGHDYWITWGYLVAFIKNNNVKYRVPGNKWVNVISWKSFSTKALVISN